VYEYADAALTPRVAHASRCQARKSRRRYSTPVQLVEEGADRSLFAPYGECEWSRS